MKQMTKYTVEVRVSGATAIYRHVEASSPEEADKKTYDMEPDEYEWDGQGETRSVKEEEE